MNLVQLCFSTLSVVSAAVVTDSSGIECAISPPLPYLSSQGYCDINGDVSGVVLLSKRSALSKALFEKEGLESSRFASASNSKAPDAPAGHVSTARVDTASSSKLLLEPFTLLSISRLHSVRGHGFSVLLILLIGICGFAGFAYVRAERRKHEIYDLPDDQECGGDGWEHEFWIKRHHGHRPQSGDSHAYRSPQPSARSLDEPLGRTAQQKRLAQPRGSPPGTSGSVGSSRPSTDGMLHPKATRDETLMHRKEEQVVALLRKREHEVEAAAEAEILKIEQEMEREKEAVERAVIAGSERVLQVGHKIQGAGVGASKKVLHSLDKVSGKAITKIRDKMQEQGAKLEQRWEEAKVRS